MKKTITVLLVLISMSLFSQKRYKKSDIKGVWVCVAPDSLPLQSLRFEDSCVFHRNTEMNNSDDRGDFGYEVELFGEGTWIYRFEFKGNGKVDVVKEKVEILRISRNTRSVRKTPSYFFEGSWKMKKNIIEIELINQKLCYQIDLVKVYNLTAYDSVEMLLSKN